MRGWEVLHNETFVGVRVGSVGEGLVSLCSAERTASGLGLGRIRESCTHLADEILEPRANVPIPLGGCFIEGYAPPDGITADQFLGNFAFCCQVKFGAYDDDWCRLMEWRGARGSGEGGGRGRSTVYTHTVVASYVVDPLS